MPNTPSSIGVSMKPGQIDVGANPDPAVVDREVLREDHDRALRRVVGATARGAFEAFDARDRDDDCRARSSTSGCSSIARDRVLAHEERAGEVDVEHPLPLVTVEQVRGPATRDTRRGHDRVDPAVLGDGRRRPRRRSASSSRTSACTNDTSGAPSGRSRSASAVR